MNSKVETNTPVKKQKVPNSGRKKGTPNKRTADIVERLSQSGIDIVAELLDICKTTSNEQTKVTVLKELLKYVYPQRKAIDLSEAVVVEQVFITAEEAAETDAHIAEVIN